MNWVIENVVKPWRPTLLGVPTAALILYFGLPSSGESTQNLVTIADCEKVTIGMSEGEVNETLRVRSEHLTLLEWDPACVFLTRWRGEGFEFFVCYDANHRVTSVLISLWGPGRVTC